MIIIDCEQGSDEWFAARAGRPTASEFSKLVTSAGAPSKSMPDYAAQLAAEMYAGKPLDRFEGNGYTERGKEMEEQARDWYAFTTDVDVAEVGFCMDDHRLYGSSPDGLIGEPGAVEFKCQIAKNHVKTLLYYKKHGKCPPEYVAQTQGEMLVCERQWVDLVFYHPDLPSFIIRQTPISAVAKGIKEQLAVCLKERDSILKQIQEM